MPTTVSLRRTDFRRIVIQPEFYLRLDPRRHQRNGMIVALVLLWANPNFAERNPGPFFRKTRRELFGSLGHGGNCCRRRDR